jgi:hypothetical protein
LTKPSVDEVGAACVTLEELMHHTPSKQAKWALEIALRALRASDEPSVPTKAYLRCPCRECPDEGGCATREGTFGCRNAVNRGSGVMNYARIGDVVKVRVNQPVPLTYVLTLKTPKAAEYATQLLNDPKSGWWLESVQRTGD